MQIAKVVGKAVSSVKVDQLVGHKLLVVENVATAAAPLRTPTRYVAVDLVGAGEGELVLVTQGTPAAWAVSDAGMPVDAAIVGILDAVSEADGT